MTEDAEIAHILRHIGKPEPATLLSEPYGDEPSYVELASEAYMRFEKDEKEENHAKGD